MKRRSFLGAGAGLAALTASSATAQDSTSLVLGTDEPAAAAALAQRVAATSGGRITLDIREIATADASELLAATSGGGIDMFLSCADAFVPLKPALGLFASMPGGMTTTELESWMVAGDGTFMLDLLTEDLGIKAFLAGDTGTQPLWSRAPVSSLADLQSLTVGSKGLGLTALSEMGVTAQDVTTADVAELDALDGYSLAQMQARGLIADFPYMIAPNANRPSAALMVGISRNKWSALSIGDQAVIERSITAEHSSQRAATAHADLTARSAAGDQITAQTLPDDIWQAQIAASNAIARAMFDANDAGADAMDAYIYFLTDIAEWSEIGEKSYVLGRNKVLAT